MRVRETATLHEKTVQKAGEMAQERKRRGPQGARRTGGLKHVAVDRRVWSKARVVAAKAGLTPRHIDVLGPTEVVVRNRPVR